MKKRNNSEKLNIIMWIILVLLLLGVIAYSIYIYTFNHTLRTYDAGNVSADFSLSISPRTGAADSWTKIVNENSRAIKYLGTIYDVTVTNIGDCTISDWQLRMNIDSACYLNNAWCGTFDIYQNVNGRQKSQRIDLRNYALDHIKLNHRKEDQDLLIPLDVGDYLIYYPDLAANEYPIHVKGNGVISQVVFGMIFCNREDVPLTFTNYHMEYYLNRVYTNSPVFWLLFAGCVIWIVLKIAMIAVAINMKKAHQRFIADEHIIRQSIGVFTHFFEAKDTYTNGHSQRVARYAQMIAQKLDMDEDKCRNVYYIALMHDCGKSYIPDEILKKPGKLTDEEYAVIKSHTVKGAEMLADFTAIDHIREGVLYHHERFDGKGYPEGLAGENIPFLGRLICMADSFDAMNSRRCYRDKLSRLYIVSEISNNRGKQFDPQMADALLALIEEGKIIVVGDDTENSQLEN